MSAQILGMLKGWVASLALSPFWFSLLSLVLGLAFVIGLGALLARRLAGSTGISSGPIFVVAGLIVLAACATWALIDAVFWFQDAPYISERLLLWIAPDAVDKAALAEFLELATTDGRLLLPTAISMTIGLFAAGVLYLLITWIASGTLAELLALEQKPADILARERKAKLEAIAAAVAAGQPPPGEELSTQPLPDDRLGRIYKLLGHWTDVSFV